jgi:hypothetical protein
MATSKKAQGSNLLATIITGIVCLAIGVVLGKFVLSGHNTADPLNKVTLSESELDTVVATYTYGGEKHQVTARDVIEDASSLEAELNEDGTYALPTADNVLAYARNKIIIGEAESRGITVTDEDISAYAMEMLGTDDFAAIASTYGLSEDVAKRMLGESAMMKALRDQILADTATVEMPANPPAEPEDGNHDATSKEYADYVIALLGDEWDAENNTWARTDGQYYATLQTYPISNEEASYEAAQQAYYVAYMAYANATSNSSQAWTDFVNGLLGSASIEIATLCA